jgi:hypothetical protein
MVRPRAGDAAPRIRPAARDQLAVPSQQRRWSESQLAASANKKANKTSNPTDAPTNKTSNRFDVVRWISSPRFMPLFSTTSPAEPIGAHLARWR